LSYAETRVYFDKCLEEGIPKKCDDNDACTADTCHPYKGCEHTPIEDCIPCLEDHECKDLDVCNGNEICHNGICRGGEPLNCDDNNACTIDICAHNGDLEGCIHIPIEDCTPCLEDRECDDFNFCNGNETCQMGACQSGESLNCDANNACVINTCDPLQGCIHTPIEDCIPCLEDRECEDYNVCNGNETCQMGICKSGESLNCDDGDILTNDECKKEIGCTHTFEVIPEKKTLFINETTIISPRIIQNSNILWYVNNIEGGNSKIGTITNGEYRAPSIDDSYPDSLNITIDAISANDSMTKGSTNIAISCKKSPLITVKVMQDKNVISVKKKTRFRALVKGEICTKNIKWSVTNGGGTIIPINSRMAVYTAPKFIHSNLQNFTIIATSVENDIFFGEVNQKVIASCNQIPGSMLILDSDRKLVKKTDKVQLKAFCGKNVTWSTTPYGNITSTSANTATFHLANTATFDHRQRFNITATSFDEGKYRSSDTYIIIDP